MKSIFRRLILFILFIINLITLLFDWHVVQGLTSTDGLVILTKNLWLSGIIICLYFFSLVFYPKNKKLFFITGLCALSALMALEFSAFETYGRFNNKAIGVYLGLATMLCNIAAWVFILKKETFEKSTEKEK